MLFSAFDQFVQFALAQWVIVSTKSSLVQQNVQHVWPLSNWTSLNNTQLCWTNVQCCSVKMFRTFDRGLRFPQRGRQREGNDSFLCFPFKKLTAKSTINDSLVNLWGNKLKKSLWKKISTRKLASGYQKKTKVDLQTLQFGRGSSGNLKTVFPALCNTTRQLHALLGHQKPLQNVISI